MAKLGMHFEENLFVFFPIIFTICVTLLCVLWYCAWSKVKRNNLELVVNFILGLLIILFIYPAYAVKVFSGTTVVIDLLQILSAIITIFVIGYLKFQYADYVMLIFLAIVIERNCILNGFGISLLFVSMWFFLCIIIKRRYSVLKKISFQTMISFISCAIVFYVYDLLVKQGMLEFYYTFSRKLNLNIITKGMFLGFLTILFLVIISAIILAIKKVLQLYIEQLKVFSEKYNEIGCYLLIIPYLVGVLLFIWDIFNIRYKYEQKYAANWIPVILFILFIGMQMFYLRLLFKTIQLKEHLEYREAENENLQVYNKDVLKNIQEIREMKHDLKNIFLTMGEYISRSEDKDLKNYYYENIAPYAKNEIKMNDLYVKLQDLQNESLKSFIYYKIMQSKDEDVDVQLETFLDHTVLPYLINPSIITRILGIFIDNAIEESSKINNGFVSIVIKEKCDEATISIKNPVRESVKKNGIYIGTTSKGLGRGNGLVIVEKLIKKHDDILWNSYFQNNDYVQSISIFKEPRP